MLVPLSWGWARTKTTIGLVWLPVRGKTTELVRQRDALAARVLFTQTSMILSYIAEYPPHLLLLIYGRIGEDWTF